MPLIRTVGLLLCVALAGCAGGERPLGYAGTATLEGVLRVGREIELSDYRVLNSSRPIDSSICMNGRLGERRLYDRAPVELHGRRVRVSGTLYDYFEYTVADPAAASIGEVQNASGNRFVIVIRSARLIAAH